MSPSEEETAANLVKRAAKDLGEHFDAVHIFASRHEPASHEGTCHVNSGVGNWFARYGQICAWVVRANAIEDDAARRSVCDE